MRRVHGASRSICCVGIALLVLMLLFTGCKPEEPPPSPTPRPTGAAGFERPAQATPAAQATQPVPATRAVQAAQAVQATDVPEPTQVAKATESTEDTQLEKPTEAVEPTKQEEPTETVETAGETQSTDPTATLVPTEKPKAATLVPTPTLVPVESSPTAFPTRVPRTPTSAPSSRPNTVYIPGGTFTMGSDSGKEDETPEQEVTVSGYNIDLYPVTNAEYKEFVIATGHRSPRNWKDGTFPEGKGDHPVVWVSWHDAQAYAAWVGKRLPTEAEWEMAARGTDGRTYPWGDVFDSTMCNSSESGIRDTVAVGSYPDNASPFGVLDMAGNVWEWTADWYDAYRGSLYEFSRFGEEFRVLRGGSWYDGADLVRAPSRNSADPDFRFSTIGFRCAE